MRFYRGRATARRLHAARVAVAATIVVVACYAAAAIGLGAYVVHRLTAQTDARLASHLASAGLLDLAGTAGSPKNDTDLDDAPVFLWRVSSSGATEASTAGAPALPHRSWTPAPITDVVDGTSFRLEAVRRGSTWLVAGQSVAAVTHARDALVLPELVFGILLAVVTFAGALAVGFRASAPLDLIRRRQAEFTADASHELRTPLSVVEAEVDLALRKPRTGEEYVAVLQRIGGEGRRLRRIVEDLLWLARADSDQAPADPREVADVAGVAASSTERFRPVAEQRGVALRCEAVGDAAVVQAPVEWIDRLSGVLVDNACKYAGPGGSAEVSVHVSGGRVTLVVEDSGPGIAPRERTAIFDRFHRASVDAGGTGLGLAIADSVVRRTKGVWSVGESRLGGARMEVSWRRVPGPPGPPSTPSSRDDSLAARGLTSPVAPG